MVYSTGKGVHGFTLDPGIGEFILSHENIKMPDPPAYYSVNHSYFSRWSTGVQEYVRWLQGRNHSEITLSERYIGSLVGDFHRNLQRGGVFIYPAETLKPQGKMRLLYEAAPLAFLAEQADGYASDGRKPILDIKPETLHQRVPLFIGNRSLVEMAETLIHEHDPE
jgi:fructose-1,6-bisphosphatase I